MLYYFKSALAGEMKVKRYETKNIGALSVVSLFYEFL